MSHLTLRLHFPRPRALTLAPLLVVLIAACTSRPIPTAAIATPVPSLRPSPVPTEETATDAPVLPTQTTTSTPAATFTPTLLPPSTSAPVQTPFVAEYPRNPRAILIRADLWGGLAPVPLDAHVPLFQLYTDGLLIYAGERAAPAAGLDATVWIGHLSETEIRNLLGYLNQVGFFSLRDYYEPRPKPTDMPTAHISVFLNKAKTVGVYAPTSESTPRAFRDAFARLTQTIPTDAQVFAPADGYLQSTDAGPISNFGTKDTLTDWSIPSVHLADASDGITVSGKAFDQVLALRATKPAGALFRDGERAFRVRFSPNLPRAVHLSDWIGPILNAPREFDGRIFEMVGYFRGWNLLGEARGNSPVTRNDWVFADASGAMYVTGAAPRGLDPSSREDAWTVIRLTARVVYVRLGTSYLEVRRVENLTPAATPVPTSVANADGAITLVKSKFPEVGKIQKAGGVAIGASSDIKTFERPDGWDIAFWEGSGDCPSGCINNRYYYFSVKKDGRVTKAGDYARVFNADKNAFELSGAPLWGYPK